MSTKNSQTNVMSAQSLNALRDEASDSFRRDIPAAVVETPADFGKAVLEYEYATNEFVGALVNKIVFQIIQRKLFRNPLGVLKRHDMPLGWDGEEIHVNPAQSLDYDGTQTGMERLLKPYKPDVETAYYRLNKQKEYPLTINYDQLRGAFTSYAALNNLVDYCVDSLYNAATIAEYQFTRELVSGAVAGNRVKTVTVAKPVDRNTSEQFMDALRSFSMMFPFPSVEYNGYRVMKPNKPGRVTWSEIEDQIIIIRADVASKVGLTLLANVFNVDYANYMARQIIVDSFGDDKTLAILADKNAFIIAEQVRRFARFDNAASLSYQYFYHCWDLYGFSPFQNAVALVTA